MDNGDKDRGGYAGGIDGDTALLAYLVACHAAWRYDPVRRNADVLLVVDSH